MKATYIAALAGGQGRFSIHSLHSFKPSSSAFSLLLIKDRTFDTLDLYNRGALGEG
jgi:hypothetical protein